MALPTVPPLSATLQDARQRWRSLKITAQRVRSQSAGGDIDASSVLALLDGLRRDLAYFQETAAVPGLGAYAQQQYDAGGYDIAADFNALTTALSDAIAWLVANIPTDANGYMLMQSLEPDGTRLDRVFTPAQTGGLRTQLDAIIAVIE